MDLTVFLDVACLSVATVLTGLGVNSLQMLARIRLEKSLFIPIIVSAVFFWFGSLENVVFNVYLEFVPSFVVAQASINVMYRAMQLLGLSVLTYGIFSYWRLTRKVIVPKHERSEKREEPQIVTEENSTRTEQVSQQAI